MNQNKAEVAQNDYTEQWREKLKQKAAERPEITGEVEIEGFRFIGRRIDLTLWFENGRVPHMLVEATLKAMNGEGDSSVTVDEQVNPDEYRAAVNFRRDAICNAVKVPQIVPGFVRPDTKDAISYFEFTENAPEVADGIVKWVLHGQPGLPVILKNGGETTVDAVASFRQRAARGSSSVSGAHGKSTRRKGKRRVRNRG
ncbi:MAG TPA: hypothetical protein VK619_12120 [Pyrinomonadaceae bacterium]|nr:hypothetical protein [Pyrinomonadaceae bacterium]